SALVALLMAVSSALPAGEPSEGDWRTRIRDALDFIRGRHLLAGLLTAQAVAFFFFYAVVPIEVVYAKKTLAAGSTGYGWLLAAWGAGMIVGSILFASAQRTRIELLMAGGTLAIGSAYFG